VKLEKAAVGLIKRQNAALKMQNAARELNKEILELIKVAMKLQEAALKLIFFLISSGTEESRIGTDEISSGTFLSSVSGSPWKSSSKTNNLQ
jgi:hypothetical protein